MGLYESVQLFSGITYASLYFLLHYATEFLMTYVFLHADIETATEPSNMKSMSGVFLILLVVIAPSYITAALNPDYTAYIDISILQRFTVVFAAILVSNLVVKPSQDVFPYGNFGYTMFLVADVVPGILQGYFAPGGYSGIKSRITTMFKSTPATADKKALRLESYLGMVFGFIACIYASIVSDVKESLVITMIATILPYFWFWFIAHTPSFTSRAPIVIQRLAIASVLLYFALVLDFGVMNIVFIIHAVNMYTGAISSQAAALTLGISSLLLYKLECDYVLTLTTGPKYWLFGWGIMTSVLSYAWLALFYDGYNEMQQTRIKGTHWQDNILAVFNIVVGGALDKAEYLVSGTLGGPVVYLLPLVTLWFSLETKLLTHLWVGTPFHPSWWMYGKGVKNQVARYAPNDWVNVTFSIATILITAVLTSYAWFATNVAVGFDAMNFSSENTWKFAGTYNHTIYWLHIKNKTFPRFCIGFVHRHYFPILFSFDMNTVQIFLIYRSFFLRPIFFFAVSHGILFIFHSGLWMIVASSGVPQIGKGPAFQVFPPEIPTLLQCDPRTCIDIHKKDLVLGHVFLFVGAFYLSDGSNTDSPERQVTKAVVGIAWAFSLISKLMIHSQHRLQPVPYFEEQKEKSD
jgi:hypothetical protein